MTPSGSWIEHLPLSGLPFRMLQWRIAGAGADRIRSTAAMLSTAYAAREHLETDDYRRGLAAGRSDYFTMMAMELSPSEQQEIRQ